VRFPINLIRMTRKAIGEGFLIGYRISGDEHVEGGLTLVDTAMITAKLARAGLDYIHLSSGRREAMRWVHPPREGMILGESARIKKDVKIPVICPNIYSPEVAIQAIVEEKADLISMGRQLLADPKWPNKVREGRYDDIQKCTRCRECIRRGYAGWKIACSINPILGHENYISDYWPPYKK
jgi:2,4-dienoyl-CoA reductase-like NADH-dependent reductase (Old Yellow Enzyme family)